MSRLNYSYKSLLEYWLYAGMLLFLAGFFVAPDNGVHKDIYYMMVVFPFLITSLSCRELLQPLTHNHYIAFGILLCLALPVLWSNDLSNDNIVRVLRNLTYLAALLIVINALVRRHPAFLQHAILALMIAALAVGIFLLTKLFLASDQITQATLVPEWRFNTQNRMAKAYGVVAILCLPLLAQHRHRWHTLLAAATLLTSIAVILLSRSKGATYALLLTAPTLLLLQRQSVLNLLRHWRWALPFVLASCAIAAEIGVVPDFASDGWSKRDYIWQAVLESARAAPLFGTGYLLDPSILATDGQTYTHEHNLFMALLRQAGLFGLVLFAGWLGLLMVNALKARDDRIVLWLILLIYGCFASLSGDKYPLHAPVEMWIWFWVPIAILLSLLPASGTTTQGEKT